MNRVNHSGGNKSSSKVERIIMAINEIEEGIEFDCHTVAERIIGHYPPTSNQVAMILGRFARQGHLTLRRTRTNNRYTRRRILSP
jgi:hypothetical protein